MWHALLTSLAHHSDNAEAAMKQLLDAAQRGVLPSYLRPDAGELDAFVRDLLEVALVPDAGHLAFVKQVLEVPGN